MNELLRRALERRQQLRGELEAIERFIYELENLEASAPTGAQRAQLGLWSGEISRSAHAAAVRAMIGRAEEMIIQAGHPLTRSALVRALEDEGHRLMGRDKIKVFGTNLWRSDRFWNIKGHGYWPKSREIPGPFSDMPRQG